MATLRSMRHERATFEGRFFERSGLFSPIARAAGTFADRSDWPSVEEYGLAFVDEAPVRFEPAAPRRRRHVRARDDLYDAMITQRRVVPTRPRMWHDYLNALVWASFPRSKLALHARQHRAIQDWIPHGAIRHPNGRTRELDMLALVDEGGVLVLESDRGPGIGYARLIFGHALYEGLVFERPAMVARAVALSMPALPSDVEALVAAADEALAVAIATPGRLEAPEALPRMPLPG